MPNLSGSCLVLQDDGFGTTNNLPSKATSRLRRAQNFAENVLQVIDDLDRIYDPFLRRYPRRSDSAESSAVSRDVMATLAYCLMETQDNFREAGKNHRVDLGYHYTQKANMARIQTDGLMTKKERSSHRIQVDMKHGSVFGDGVYTGNNPYCFRKYGEVGLLVARIQGMVRFVEVKGRPTMDGAFDTVVGNKLGRFRRLTCSDDVTDNTPHDEVVLLTSKQCLPLVKYDRDLIPKTPKAGYNPIEKYHAAMQSVVDEYFNNK